MASVERLEDVNLVSAENTSYFSDSAAKSTSSIKTIERLDLIASGNLTVIVATTHLNLPKCSHLVSC